MRKVTFLSIVLVIIVLAAAAFAGGVIPSPKALQGTTWVGVLTFVHSDGTGTETDNATLTFGSNPQTGNFLSGTLACKANSTCNILPEPPATPLNFSCIRNGDELQMAADGYSMSALLFMGPPVKRGSPPHQNMAIEGSNLGLGDMFQGTLIKQ